MVPLLLFGLPRHVRRIPPRRRAVCSPSPRVHQIANERERIQFFNSSILFGMLEVIKKGHDSRTGVSPEAEGRAAKQSLEVCRPVRNAPAGRCTMPSRTAGSAVQDMNARAARSTTDSRTGSLPVQNENAPAARSTSVARCTMPSRTAGSAVQDTNAPAARSTSVARCATDSRTGCQPVQEDNIL